MADWFQVTCINCNWTTPSTHDWNNEYSERVTADTDCPNCGYHDSVRDGADVPAPGGDLLKEVIKEINREYKGKGCFIDFVNRFQICVCCSQCAMHDFNIPELNPPAVMESA